MRVFGEDWGSGENWFPREINVGQRAFTVVAGDSLGSSTHLSSCGCAGCLSKVQVDSGNGAQPEDAFTGGNGVEADETSGTDSVGNTTGTASTLAIGASTNGWVNTAGDDDWYAVTLVAGQSYTFSLVGGTLSDAYLELRDSAGNLIGIDDDFGTAFNSTIRWTATTSGTYYVNARAWEGATPTLTGSYTLSAAISAPASPLDSINYHFTMPTTNIAVWFSTPGYTNPSGDATLRSWTQAEIDAVMAALATYSAITPLTFSVAASQATATWIFTLADLPGNTLGYFAVGANYSAFDPNVTNFTAGLTPGGSSWATIIHEAGHGLGMAHPHDNGAENYGPDNSEIMQGLLTPFNSYGTFLMNQGVFTTMSYNDGWALSGFGSTPSTLTGAQGTPMALDVALMQQRYGVNPNTGSGNTAYTLALASSAYTCIWDVSGTDSISYAGSGNATIDLRAATLLNAVGGGGFVSFVFGVHGGFTIANGVLIENATSGTGDDTLNGNDAANTLDAGFGTDTLNGNGGNDRLIGGTGNDLINGGAGIDTSVLTIASTSATWVRDPSGSWTVTANGSDTITGVEYLEFTDRTVFLDRAYSTFSGDGTSDVFMRHSSGAMGVWFVGASGVTGAAGLGAVDVAWAIEGVADLNGDGRDDILMRNNNGNLGVWFMNGAAASGAAGLGNISLSWDITGLGDLNGDGFDDMVMWNANGSLGVWFMNNGVVSGAAGLGNLSQATWDFEGLGDFNGDGRDDILWRNSAGDTGIWFMNGGTATGAGIGNIPTGWVIEGIGDFNGDGRDDILMRDGAGNLGAWFMNGASATGVGLGNVGSSFAVAAIGDYNGDGRDDILWWNDNGSLGAWFMNGAAATAIGYGGVTHDWIINPGG